MKFSLEQIPESTETVYLTFELYGTPSADFTSADFYQVDNDWEGTTVTFDDFPARIAAEPVTSFTKAMTSESLIQRLNVTEAVREARKSRETEISFEISIPTAAKNNYLEIYSSRSTNEKAVKPTLELISGYLPERVVKKNLSFLVELASVIKGTGLQQC